MVLSSGSLILRSHCLHSLFSPAHPLDFKCSTSHYHYDKLSPSLHQLSLTLHQTLALSTLNTFPLYLKHLLVVADISGPGKI